MNKKVASIGVVIIVLLVEAGSYVWMKKSTAPKVYHVGILSGIEIFSSITDGFKQKMAQLGYVEGKNIVYDVQNLNPDSDAYRTAIQKFIADKDDLIVTFPTEPSVEAKTLTQGTGIPVLFAMAAIEDIDLVDSVTKPGSDLTGARYPSPELAVQRFDLLLEMMPKLKNLWLIYDSTYPATKSAIAALRPVAAAAGVNLVEDHVLTVADIQAALAKRGAQSSLGVDAILIMPETLVQSPDGWPLVAKFAADHQLPIAGSASFEADSGAVFSYIPDNVVTGELIAPMADKIFKGIPAGTIPVATPESYLRINYTLAQKLGLTLSADILARANEIIH